MSFQVLKMKLQHLHPHPLPCFRCLLVLGVERSSAGGRGSRGGGGGCSGSGCTGGGYQEDSNADKASATGARFVKLDLA